MPKNIDWYGLYAGRWTDVVDESMAHPAKFPVLLIRRIYEYAIESGMVGKGDKVADPFGGVAFGAFYALMNDMDWIGVEIEQKFVDVGKTNIAYWSDWLIRFLDREHVSTADIVLGDSTKDFVSTASPCDFIVSSPPFESVTSDRPSKSIVASGLRMGRSSMGDGYGDTDGNIGNMSGAQFENAARLIVQQSYNSLKPGGYAAWITRAFVRNKTIVPFPDKWEALCNSEGFTTVAVARSWLTKTVGVQESMFGESQKITKTHKTFFRKLAEKRGSPPVDYDVIYFMQKT